LGDEEAAGAEQLRRFDRPPGSHGRVRHAGATSLRSYLLGG
jgi:hypothetical protein